MPMTTNVNGVEVDIGKLPRDTRGRLAFDFIAFASVRSSDEDAVMQLALASADELLERFGLSNLSDSEQAGH